MNTETPSAKEPGEVLVKAENVGKIFCRNLRHSLFYGLQDGLGDLVPGIGRKYDKQGNPILRKNEFWANQGISFELRRGECLGLIGRNGAGKTTLLKMLNGLIKPDTGRIEMRGKVGAIIALGAGFNPLLTGRENVYIAGSVRGLTKKEIDAKYDEIVDFAELHDFMDSPVQSYSSGMQVRLGFSVASIIEPDILIIDEVLAVGDAAFRNKCYNIISNLLHKTAVIFVSHNMDQIGRICTNGLVLENGTIKRKGTIIESISHYESTHTAINQDQSFTKIIPPIKYFSYKTEKEVLESGCSISIKIILQSENIIHISLVRFVFYSNTGERIASADFLPHKFNKEIRNGENKWHMTISQLPLRRGNYKISVSIQGTRGESIVWSYKTSQIKITSDSRVDTPCILKCQEWNNY
jgi:lipopolysaccharide transport system ATP-binding protein